MKKHMIRNICLVALLCSMIMLNGCASIICGGEKTINVTSDPEGSDFTITDRKGNVVTKGTTPTNVTLKRGSGYFKGGDYMISFEKEGYEPVDTKIHQGVEILWYGVGNAVFGGLIGWIIVDPLTGAMFTIDDVNVNLDSSTTSMLLPVQQQTYSLENVSVFSNFNPIYAG